MSYTLYIKDTPLIRFDFHERHIPDVSISDVVSVNAMIERVKRLEKTCKDEISVLEYKKNEVQRFPLAFLNAKDGFRTLKPNLEELLSTWLSQRRIPSNRTFVLNILKQCGMEEGSSKEIIDFCQMMSLNDTYRVLNDEHPFVPFADCNLYKNRFDKILSLIAYLGYSPNNFARKADCQGGLCSTPELTTQGMLPKAWRWTDNGVVLYKGGTSGYANAGLEPYSEFYACQVALRMGVSSVPYGLERWHGILASTCPLFTSTDLSFVPAFELMTEKKTLVECIDVFSRIGLLKPLSDLLLLDAVICNEDRHFANFGVLRDNDSGNIIGMAPSFDHGLSLCCYAMKDDIDHIDDYIETRSPAYRNVTFDDIVDIFKMSHHNSMLRSLIGFEFFRHPRYNLPERRLKKLEHILKERSSKFLSIRPVHKKQEEKQKDESIERMDTCREKNNICLEPMC